MSDDFDTPETPTVHREVIFMVDLDGYEGPLDVLLSLARDQKLDITQISILALADQYLKFIAAAQQKNLEIAADYLVMAAWLAYMKSRLLLPDLGGEDEPTGEEMAAALAFQIKRLEAMQEAGHQLMARPRLGQDFFARGAPEKHPIETEHILEVTLFELLQAYARQRRRGSGGDRTLHIEPFEVYTVEDALKRLRRLMGRTPDWQSLWSYLPEEIRGGLFGRSAVASTFAASLELAKEGKVNIRQSDTFGPIYLRQRTDGGEGAGPRAVAGDGEDGGSGGNGDQ
ncbi:MAG TPA: segregation/condensation protein A [Rhodospirillaceae bacterium]|nr:segregation/condensation protein A [Rhodospirillaceae bacterium]